MKLVLKMNAGGAASIMAFISSKALSCRRIGFGIGDSGEEPVDSVIVAFGVGSGRRIRDIDAAHSWARCRRDRDFGRDTSGRHYWRRRRPASPYIDGLQSSPAAGRLVAGHGTSAGM